MSTADPNKRAGPAVVQARHAVDLALADLPPGSTVLVAFSGGPDSSALAAATAFVAPRRGLRPGAVIVDHGLQSDSATIASWARDVALRLGLEFAETCRVQVGTAGGPEAAARQARYAALGTKAEEHHATAVLLAHTLDDQAETVLLRLARGSGARSLSGMRDRYGLWRRPFLDLPRSLVRVCAEESLAGIGERPWQDPHNLDPRFTRPRVRAALGTLTEALGADIVGGLARTAAQLRDDADALDAIAEQAEVDMVSATPDEVSCPAAALACLPRAVRTRIIRAMCLRVGCEAGAVTAEHIWSVERLVTHWHGQGPIPLPGGARADRRHGRLAVHRPTDREPS